MAAIRPLTTIAGKYERVTPGRAAELGAGVRAPKEDWKEESLASEDAWVEATEAATRERRRSKGVEKTSTADWQRAVIEKGVKRYPDGVRLGAAKYSKNFAPFRDTIQATELPPRGPKGDPDNIERVRKIAEALRRKKLELLGGGGGA